MRIKNYSSETGSRATFWLSSWLLSVQMWWEKITLFPACKLCSGQHTNLYIVKHRPSLLLGQSNHTIEHEQRWWTMPLGGANWADVVDSQSCAPPVQIIWVYPVHVNLSLPHVPLFLFVTCTACSHLRNNIPNQVFLIPFSIIFWYFVLSIISIRVVGSVLHVLLLAFRPVPVKYWKHTRYTWTGLVHFHIVESPCLSSNSRLLKM